MQFIMEHRGWDIFLKPDGEYRIISQTTREERNFPFRRDAVAWIDEVLGPEEPKKSVVKARIIHRGRRPPRRHS